MPRTSKQETPIAVDEPMIEVRVADLGGCTVAYETDKADFDPAALFRGLPDDRCQCPHWGVVVKGQIIFRYADRDEVFHAGDAYYAAPGHVPLMFGGAEVIEFSPTDRLQETTAVIEANMKAMA
ncbi:cupin domain-containing protein [Actinomadura montaniterrae]|uniref:Cupin domain-containing protein n=1 Tax=Actinomadura montaniterrae TaxID=1803903 RepID=A0A6L3VPJ5_9ACTN|nr:cupin domain-containing protein [Actinomadura montaniterrae]KAB2365755.1 cupin domain-containing protein [Actinomadura montaniterrae]